VSVEGIGADGKPVERSWHLLAEGDDGPLIPSMAAEGIIRHCLAGRPPAAGARSGATDLELADYEMLFARRRIATGCRQAPPDGAPLYRRLLGDAWDRVPAAVRAMHDLDRERDADGVAIVERGKGVLARAVAWLFGFPHEGSEVPVSVSFRVRDGREYWTRTFAGRSFTSTQEEGSGRFDRLLCERFGPFNFAMALVLEEDRLRLVVRRWSAFGIPMPLVLAPGGDAWESGEDGRFHFHVEIGHRFIGRIVAYRGWLMPRT
jgi:hypothetical protein